VPPHDPVSPEELADPPQLLLLLVVSEEAPQLVDPVFDSLTVSPLDYSRKGKGLLLLLSLFSPHPAEGYAVPQEFELF